MTRSKPLQARLTTVNNLIDQHQQLRNKSPRGSKERKRHTRALRSLKKTRRRLRADRWKYQGATAIIKYEVIPLLVAAGVPITSRKRWETFGNPDSDHYKGNRNADAADGGTAENYSLGSEIKQALTNNPQAKMVDYEEFIIERSHTGSPETYRIQIIAGTHGTGPHLHIGCKRVSP